MPYLIVLKDGELDLLLLVLVFLGCGVVLLLALFATTSQPQDQMKGRLFLNVVIRQSAAILQLLTSKNQSLLVRGNA